MCICSHLHPSSRLKTTVPESVAIQSWLLEKLHNKLKCPVCSNEGEMQGMEEPFIRMAIYCLECQTASDKISYVCENCSYEMSFNARYILYKFIRPTPLSAIGFSE